MKEVDGTLNPFDTKVSLPRPDSMAHIWSQPKIRFRNELQLKGNKKLGFSKILFREANVANFPRHLIGGLVNHVYKHNTFRRIKMLICQMSEMYSFNKEN